MIIIETNSHAKVDIAFATPSIPDASINNTGKPTKAVATIHRTKIAARFREVVAYFHDRDTADE